MIEGIFEPQEHEIALRQHFGASVFYEGTVIFNVPLYVLGFSNRSGSNLMAEYLHSTGKFALIEEKLNYDAVLDTACTNHLVSFPEVVKFYLDGMLANGRLPGFKANWGQLVMLYRFGIFKMFPAVRLVNMVRRDLLGQAISFSIASQTGQWTSLQHGAREPEYIFPDIVSRLVGASFGNLAMELIADSLSIERVSLAYEDLESDPEWTVKQVAAAFGLDLGEWRPNSTTLQRQRSEINETMKKLFFADIKRGISSAP